MNPCVISTLTAAAGLERFMIEIKLQLLFEDTSLQRDSRLDSKEITVDLFKMRQMTFKRLGLVRSTLAIFVSTTKLGRCKSLVLVLNLMTWRFHTHLS